MADKTKINQIGSGSNATPVVLSGLYDYSSTSYYGEIVPMIVDEYGKIKNSLSDSETGKAVNVSSLGELKTTIPVRLVGTAFNSTTKDTNFWTETVSGSGAITQSGEITLSTGETANSSAKYETIRKARKVPGTSMQFRLVGRQKETVAADCIRRAGPYNDDDGFFFQYDGTTFGVGHRKDGVDTVVTNGNFNGNAGATISVDETAFTRLVIEYTVLHVKFFVNGNLIHTITAVTESLITYQDLPITIEIENENDNTTDNGFEVLFATILRLGNLETESQYKYIGTDTTTVCKYGAGRLKRIVNVDNAGDVTVYDNTEASGTQIAVIDTAKALGTLDFDVPFNDGLTIVTATSAKVVVIYE